MPPSGTVTVERWPGLCSATHAAVYGPTGTTFAIPTDRLNEGLSKLLDVKVGGYTNTHQQRGPAHDYRSWYDGDMVQWVQVADRRHIARYGFTFFDPSPQAVYTR